MQKAADILFTVKFEDGKKVQMTAEQIAKLRDARRWEVMGHRGEVIARKIYRGL